MRNPVKPTGKNRQRPREQKEKKPPRVWGKFDLMPVHGKYYRLTLATVVGLNPEYFQWWVDTCKPELTDELKQLFEQSQFRAL